MATTIYMYGIGSGRVDRIFRLVQENFAPTDKIFFVQLHRSSAFSLTGGKTETDGSNPFLVVSSDSEKSAEKIKEIVGKVFPELKIQIL